MAKRRLDGDDVSGENGDEGHGDSEWFSWLRDQDLSALSPGGPGHADSGFSYGD